MPKNNFYLFTYTLTYNFTENKQMFYNIYKTKNTKIQNTLQEYFRQQYIAEGSSYSLTQKETWYVI